MLPQDAATRRRVWVMVMVMVAYCASSSRSPQTISNLDTRHTPYVIALTAPTGKVWGSTGRDAVGCGEVGGIMYRFNPLSCIPRFNKQYFRASYYYYYST